MEPNLAHRSLTSAVVASHLTFCRRTHTPWALATAFTMARPSAAPSARPGNLASCLGSNIATIVGRFYVCQGV